MPKECLFCALADDMERCIELYHMIVAHTQEGGAVYFLTLTIPHRGDDPAHLLADLLVKSWDALNKHRSVYFKKKQGVSCWVRVWENTFGRHGIHPHFHVALFFDEPLEGTRVLVDGSSDQISQRLLPALEAPLPHEHEAWSWDAASVYAASLLSDWKRIVEKKAPEIIGRTVEVGYQAQDFRSMGTVGSLPSYLAKAGMGAALELGYTKGKEGRYDGRSVLELLDDICVYGREEDIRLWLEYRHMVEGRRLYSTSTRDRNPKRMFEEVEVAPMPPPPDEVDEEGRSVRWVKLSDGEPFFIAGWLYRALYRAELWLVFTHEAERLGYVVVTQALVKVRKWFDDEPPDDKRALRVAAKLVSHLVHQADVSIEV